MKIILADSHGPIMGKDQTSANLSLLYLGAYIREKTSFKSKLTYIPQAKSDQFHLDSIASFKPKIYAVSFTSFSALITYELINKIKEHYPEVIVICGGPHAINHSKEILEKSKADVCVIGEGEETFLELCEQIHTDKVDFSSVKGLAYIS